MPTPNFKTILFISISSLFINACGSGSSGSKTAEDKIPPTVKLKGSNPLYLSLNKAFVDLGATATDNIDGDISKKITQTNNIKINKAACYSQQYKVKDSSNNSAIKNRMVFIGTDKERHSPNQKPIANFDNKTTEYNKVITINVLKNDTDKDCDSLKVSSITQAITGKTTLNKNNTISFDPKGNVGSFFFKYTMSDNHGGTATSSVTIASHNPKDGNSSWPTLKNDKVTTKKNTPIFIDMVANDSDDDGDAIILDMVDDPSHGSVVKRNGGATYTPDLNYVGTDVFYYGVHDGYGHNGTATVTVTISK